MSKLTHWQSRFLRIPDAVQLMEHHFSRNEMEAFTMATLDMGAFVRSVRKSVAECKVIFPQQFPHLNWDAAEEQAALDDFEEYLAERFGLSKATETK